MNEGTISVLENDVLSNKIVELISGVSLLKNKHAEGPGLMRKYVRSEKY